MAHGEKSLNDIFTEEQAAFLEKLGYDRTGDVRQIHPTAKSSILHDAVDCERKDIVEQLLLQKVNVNARNEDRDSCHYTRTPLLIAIARGNESIVNLLLDNGADAKICEDTTGASPLMLAAAIGTQGMLASLLKKIPSHDINQENTLVEGGGIYKTPVMYAARAGQSLNAQFLLEQGANRENSQEIDVLECCLDDMAREELVGYFNQKTASSAESKNHFSQKGNTLDIEAFAKQIRNKHAVILATEEFIKKGGIQKAAPLLEEMSHSSEISPYWDIDGGFEAMALLGNEFNMKHAHYFMTRIKKDPGWRAKPAADALLKLAEKVTDEPAIQAMIIVMSVLFETKYSDYDVLMGKITTIIGKATIDSHISSLLKSELESPVELDSHISTWAEFENAIAAKSRTSFSLLEIACSRGIARTFNDASTTIQLANGITINIGSTRDYQTIKNFFTSLKQDKTTLKRDAIIKIEKAASAIPEEKFHLMIYDALKDKNKVAHVAQFALGNKIISKETLANLFQRLIQEAPQSIKGYWDVDGGFDTMAMLGDQFNVIHADYFIDRINAGSQQSSAAALNAIKKLASNITEEKASAIPALSKIATYLKNDKPMLFDEIKDALGKRFKLGSINDGEVQLALLKQAKASKGGLFKYDVKSSKAPLPQAGRTVKTQKKVVYHGRIPEQAKTSKTGVFKHGKTFPLQASQTAGQDRPIIYRVSALRSATTTT